MKTITVWLIALSLVAGLGIAMAQNVKTDAPRQSLQADPMFRISNPPRYLPRLSPEQPVVTSLRKPSPGRQNQPNATQFEIGKMANTFGTLGDDRINISLDPYSNSVAVIQRGNDRTTPSSVGNKLYVHYSSDGGGTWSAAGSDIALGISSSPRYPQVSLINPTKATTTSGVKVSVLWPQVKSYGSSSNFGEVNAMSSNYGNASPQYSQFPSPPDWSIPSRIIPNVATNSLYTLAQAVDPATGQGANDFYFIKSTDNGKNWIPLDVNTPAWSSVSVPQGYSANTLMTDVSPDGSHAIIAYVLLEVTTQGIFYLTNNHKIAYLESTDGGRTWPTDPVYLSLSDMTTYTPPFNGSAKMGWELDVAYDVNNIPHFLITASMDLNPFNPADEAPEPGKINLNHVDSTFMCEVSRKGNDWYLNNVGQISRVMVTRKSFSQAYSDGSERYYTIYTEPHWARSIDGNQIYAKWIDTDSTWKPTYDNTGAITSLASDTIHNIWVSGRDIRSNRFGGGWTPQIRVTSNTTVGAKFSKLAYFSGMNGQLHITYTEWGVGERPDDDPNNSDCTIWYLKDVSVPTAVSVRNDAAPAPLQYTLEQNYPNPFNPTTGISFTLPAAGKIRLRVFDLLGKEIATLASGMYEAGEHRVTFDAKDLPGGIYVYRLEAGAYTATRKMTLIK